MVDTAEPTSPMNLFDRRLVRCRRARAAAAWPDHDFLVREVAARLAERLDEVNRRFPRVLDLGCHGGEIGAALRCRDDIDILAQCDLSARMARRARDSAGSDGAGGDGAGDETQGRSAPVLVGDEEALPFANQALDLVLSCLSLHWVNDLPGALTQIRRCLKPDGLFMAAMLGGETLVELRRAWMEAEIAEEGGAGIHVSPFADIRDVGHLLQRAGFALPLADVDTITVTYPDALALMRELRAMGEANAVHERRRVFTRRTTLARVAAAYHDMFAGPDGRVPATFQVIYLTGWAPHGSQPKPLRPGSATARLADALEVPERPAEGRES